MTTTTQNEKEWKAFGKFYDARRAEQLEERASKLENEVAVAQYPSTQMIESARKARAEADSFRAGVATRTK